MKKDLKWVSEAERQEAAENHAARFIQPQVADVAENDVQRFNGAFPGRVANIVGKGISLDNIRPEHFSPHPQDPIFCTNSAIKIINKLGLDRPIFLVQQDSGLGEKAGATEANVVLLHNRLRNVYRQHPWRFFYRAVKYGLTRSSLSGECAIVCTQIMGCQFFRMLCFDASVNGDLRYPTCLYKGNKVAPEVYLAFAYLLESRIGNLPTEFILPEPE